MNWLNLETKILHSPEYIGSDPVARATWLNVILWCAGQENGGCIEGAATWKDRQWQQTCGVTAREVQGASPLLIIDGARVGVWSYPLDKELEVKAKRDAGRLGGVKSGASRSKHNPASASSTPSSSASSSGASSASTEGNGKEGEGNGKESPYSPPAGDVLVPELGLDSGDQTAEPKAPLQSRAEKLFGKRPTTPWDHKEQKAWLQNHKAVEGTPEPEWQLLEWFYSIPERGTFRRRDLATLIRNWASEIDRAKSYKAKAGDNARHDLNNAF